MPTVEHFFLCGIGGSGMMPLALVLRARGQAVSGSDRSFDQGQNLATRELLQARGIRLFPQDGSGVAAGATVLVVSSAIEPTVPDVAAALARGLPVRQRAAVLRDEIRTIKGEKVEPRPGASRGQGFRGGAISSKKPDLGVDNFRGKRGRKKW